MSGFWSDLADGLSTAGSAVKSLFGIKTPAKLPMRVDAGHRALSGQAVQIVNRTTGRTTLADWPLIIPSGPERQVYPGEMGTFDLEKTAVVALVGVGILYYMKSKKRRNPSRRRRTRR